MTKEKRIEMMKKSNKKVSDRIMLPHPDHMKNTGNFMFLSNGKKVEILDIWDQMK